VPPPTMNLTDFLAHLREMLILIFTPAPTLAGA
jgi:hypothetical protein